MTDKEREDLYLRKHALEQELKRLYRDGVTDDEQPLVDKANAELEEVKKQLSIYGNS